MDRRAFLMSAASMAALPEFAARKEAAAPLIG